MHAAITAILRAPIITVVVVLWVPVLLEIAAVLKARFRGAGAPSPEAASPDGRLLFLVPAHDEEGMIAACVGSVLETSYPADRRRIVVIADNCTDRTAEVAEARGAECLRRADPSLPGKPRAIRWALDRLDTSGWDAVVILDADSIVAADFCSALARRSPLRSKVLQGYFGTLNETENWLTRLAGLLSRLRYEHNYPIKEAAGLSCPLTGNGMVIGMDALSERGWQAFSLTENWELYADFTARGTRIGLASDARILSQEAKGLGQSVTQRKRWMAGRLWVLARYGPALLRSARIGLLQKLDALCELAFPSPALHGALAGAAAVGALAAWPAPAGRWVAIASLTSLSGMALGALIVLRRHPEPIAVLRSFLMAPVYVMWRCGVAVTTLFTLGDSRWRKTKRH